MGKFEDQLSEAFTYAAQVHGAQARKSGVPTISHLMAVAGLVMENEGSEVEIIAALLHDIVEDHGGRTRLEEIRSKFGDRVAKVVEECCDSFPENKRDRENWLRRKREYIKKLSNVSESALKIEVADKLHNARMTYRDAKIMKRLLWERLGRSPEMQVAYFKAMHRMFERVYPHVQTSELGHVVSQLESLCDAAQLKNNVDALTS